MPATNCAATGSMRAVVAHGIGDLRVEPRPVPTPGPGEIAVRVRYGGICGSDLHYWRHGAVGEFRVREPLVLGHEIVGVVLQTGAGVPHPPAPGTPVAVHPATPCGTCPQCAAGHRNTCPTSRYLGSAAHFPHVQGGFSDVVVLPAAQVLALPPGLDLLRAAVAEPAAVAWHAVRRAGDVRGKRVLVTGAGPIGCLVISALRAAGSGEITVTDLHPEPLAAAASLGATRTLRAGEPFDNLQVDIAIESSGSPAGLATCIGAIRPGGLLVGLGLLAHGGAPVAVNTLITRELNFAGSFRFDTALADVLDALSDGRLATDPVVTAVLPVEQAAEAFALAASPDRSCKVLLDFGTEASAGLSNGGAA